MRLNSERKTHLYIEAIRIFACLLVIFNHTGDLGFSMFTTREPGSRGFWILMVPSIFCKVAVYLFFCITGALLLGKDEPIAVIWKRRIPKAFVALLVFSLFYYLCDVNRGEAFSALEFLKRLLQNKVSAPLWYMYSYIGILICLPFTRQLVKHMKDEHFLYMFLLVFVFDGLLPMLSYYSGITLGTSLNLSWLLERTFFYPCIGYYLHNRFDVRKNRAWILPLWLMNIVTITLSCYSTYHYGINSGIPFSQANSQAFHTTFVMVNCVAVYITFRYLFENFKISDAVSSAIVKVGGCTLGIYLLHWWFLEYFTPYVHFRWGYPWTWNIPLTVAVVIDCITVFMMAMLVTLLLKKIPAFRYFL